MVTEILQIMEKLTDKKPQSSNSKTSNGKSGNDRSKSQSNGKKSGAYITERITFAGSPIDDDPQAHYHSDGSPRSRRSDRSGGESDVEAHLAGEKSACSSKAGSESSYHSGEES